MEKLLEILKDGHARTKELLAMELHTSVEDVDRKLEFLENAGIIKRVDFSVKNCSGCGSCSSETCKGCLPEDGFKNMGQMWEVL